MIFAQNSWPMYLCVLLKKLPFNFLKFFWKFFLNLIFEVINKKFSKNFLYYEI